MKRHAKGRNRIIAAATAVMLFAVQFFAVSICFAADFSMKSVRDATLYLSIPKDWQIEESGSTDEDVDLVEAGSQAFKVLELKDENGARQAQLWIYADPGAYGYYYCDTEGEARQYYEDSGADAVDGVIEEAFPELESWVREDPEYLKEEDGFTYVIREDLKVDGKNYLTYLTCDFTGDGGVHEVLIAEGNADRDTVDQIAESIEGYGYAMELLENVEYTSSGGSDASSYGDIEEDNWNIGKLFNLAICLAAAAVLLALVRNKRAGRDSMKRTRSVRKSDDRWVFKELKAKHADHEEHEDCAVSGGTRYAGYRESLKTLHKSGLLTTKEMNELLEKHKNDI